MTTLSAVPGDTMPPPRRARAHTSGAPLGDVQPAPELERIAQALRDNLDDFEAYAYRCGGWAQLGLMLGVAARVARMERAS